MPDIFKMSDVMISYSRRDKPFVERLDHALRATGREIWVDWEDIPTGTDFIQEIFAGIEASDIFVFVISPDSVSSPVCLEEVRHAVLHKKRFVPILHREITNEQKDSFHPALGAHNWLFFRDEDDFNSAFQNLIHAIETDLDHVRYHTRLLVRARDWDSKGRNNSLTLRGDDLTEAETWLKNSGTKVPEPTELQINYIHASRRASNNRRNVIIATGAAILLITFLALFAFYQSQAAQVNANNAVTQAAIAQNNAATATIAQGQAVQQAGTAQAAGATSQYNFAQAATQAIIAQNNAVTATIAQGQAIQQAGTAQAAGATSQYNFAQAATQAILAQNNAATATNAQGEAIFQANVAVTQVKLAQQAADDNATAQSVAQAQAILAQNNAATATIAQGQALLEANNAATQASIALENAQIAQQNAATATIAQGQAVIQATIAGQQAGTAVAAGATSDYNANLAARQAGTAVAAGATSDYNANLAAQQASIAQNNAATAQVAGTLESLARATSDYNANYAVQQAATAVAAQNEAQAQATIAGQQAGTAVAAKGTAESAQATNVAQANIIAQQNAATATVAQGVAVLKGNQSLSLSLLGAADQALRLNDSDLALALAVRASTTDPDSVEAHRKLMQTAYMPGTRLIFGLGDGLAGGGAVTSLSYSPDGKTALSTAKDGKIILWDAITGHPIRQFGTGGDGHQGAVNGGAFSADGRQILTGGDDGDLIIWETETGKIINRIGKSKGDNPGPIIGVGFRSDGRLISSSGANVIVWNQQTGTRQFTTDFVADAGGNMALGSNRQIVLVGRKVYSANRNQSLRPFKSGWIGAISPDNQRVVLAAKDSPSAFIGDISTGAEGSPLYASDTITALLFSPDNQYVLVGTSSGALDLWDIANGFTIRNYYGHTGAITSLAFSPDGQFIISGSASGQVRLWETAPEGLLNRFNTLDGVVDMAYSPDGKRVILAGGSQVPSLYDVAAGKEIRKLYGHSNFLASVAYSPDGKFVASGDASGTIILWDASKYTLVRRLEGHKNNVYIAFSPDSRHLFSGSADGDLKVTLRVWDVNKGQVLLRLVSDAGPVFGVAYSPDGKTLLSVYRDTMILWNAEDGKEIRRLAVSGNVVFIPQGLDKAQHINTVYSPDGKLVLYSTGNVVYVWDVNTGQTRRLGNDADAHKSLVQTVAFSPDGSLALSVAGVNTDITPNQGEANLWDVRSGQLLYTYILPEGIQQPVLAFNAAGGGFGLSVQMGDGGKKYGLQSAFLRFRVDTRKGLLDWVKANRYLRDFSCAERTRYGLESCDAATLALTPTAAPATVPIASDGPLNVRGGPNENAGVIATVNPGTPVQVIGTFEAYNAEQKTTVTWVRILLSNGKQGWVRAQFVGR